MLTSCSNCYIIRPGITVEQSKHCSAVMPLWVILLLFIVSLIFTPFPHHSHALEIADSSGIIQDSETSFFDTTDSDYRIQLAAIQKVLQRYDSPMQFHAATFMKAAYVYNLHPYFVPSISGLESQFGKHIWPGSYNGWGWGGGKYMFPNWDDAIMEVARGIRVGYIGRDAITIERISHIYAPPSHSWAGKVTLFMRQFYAAEQDIRANQDLLQLEK